MGNQSAGPSDYIQTARQVVSSIQQRVMLKFLLEGVPSFNDDEQLDELKEFVEQRGQSGQVFRRRHRVLCKTGECRRLPIGVYPSFVPQDDAASDQELLSDLRDRVAKEPAHAAVDDGRYFIAISRRTKFRRLHMIDGCHVHHEKCQQVEFVRTVDASQVDAICQDCKKKMGGPSEKSPAEDSSSSGSSSSTDDESGHGDPLGASLGFVFPSCVCVLCFGICL